MTFVVIIIDIDGYEKCYHDNFLAITRNPKQIDISI